MQKHVFILAFHHKQVICDLLGLDQTAVKSAFEAGQQPTATEEQVFDLHVSHTSSIIIMISARWMFCVEFDAYFTARKLPGWHLAWFFITANAPVVFSLLKSPLSRRHSPSLHMCS